MEDKYNAKKEIENICYKYKIFFQKENDEFNGIEEIEKIGYLNLLHDKLFKFAKSKKQKSVIEIEGLKILAVKEDIEENEIEDEPDREDFLISRGINTKTGREEFSVSIDRVSEYLIEKHNFKTWFGVSNDYCFNYNGKTFSPGARGLIKVECERILRSYCKRNIVDEVFEKIKRRSKIDKEEFEKTDKNLIALENGVWDIKRKKLISHSPNYNFQFFIPQKYNPDAECPMWEKFILEVLYPEDIPAMQEWFGFNLYREYFIKKGVICVGEQDTGKSVLLDTLIKFIGEKNKTGLSLQKITGGSDFTKLSLKEKHSNVYDDLSSKDLSDGGAFKVATGGGYISGEEKFGEYQQFRSFAKQMFATNKIPPVKDNDDLAYFGRWIVFRFNNVVEKLDPFLRSKLWTEKEMSGILNWALEGLNRLLENGKFSYNKSSQQIKEIMEISGCPLVAFSSGVLEKEEGNIITKDEMFNVYSKWCEIENRPRLSKEMLGRQLDKYCSYIYAEKHKERIWKNAKFQERWENISKKTLNVSNNDTTDTFKNIISRKKDISQIQDIIKNKASEETPKNSIIKPDSCDKCGQPGNLEMYGKLFLHDQCYNQIEKEFEVLDRK